MSNLNLVLCIIHVVNHWILGAIYTNLRKYIILDSLCSNFEYGKKLITELLVELKLDNFICSHEPKKIQQKDSINCGIYVIYYAISIINGISIQTINENQINILEKRREFYVGIQDIFSHSENNWILTQNYL